MGLLLIFGPTGAGKTRLIKLLVERNNLKYISPDITRTNRDNETDKTHISHELFQSRKAEGYYIFINELFEASYGTPKYIIEEALSEPEITYVLDFPIEYVDKIEKINGHKYGVIILPPSKSELEKRLRTANRENRIIEGMKQYDNYLSISNSNSYSFIERNVVINDEVEKAYNTIIKLTNLKYN